MSQCAGGKLQTTEAWEQMRDALGEAVARLVGGLRAGQFPVFSRNDQCTSCCPMRTVCRVNQARSLEKTWEPPP